MGQHPLTHDPCDLSNNGDPCDPLTHRPIAYPAVTATNRTNVTASTSLGTNKLRIITKANYCDSLSLFITTTGCSRGSL